MKKEQSTQPPVAIIGIGCIFAESPDLKAFYRVISKGVNGIADPPDSHQQLKDYFDPNPKKPDHIYCNRGGFLPSIDFDPTEFSIPPNVIEATDTSQLLGLVTAKRALEDAGYGEKGKTFNRNKASVILGVTGTQELVIPLGSRLGHPIWRRALKDSGVPEDQANEVVERIGEEYVSWQENSFPGLLGNVVAGRISNRLDLGGTNCVVDAACASSMGAIHMGLLELRSKRSDLVITGGVDTINDAFMHMCFSKTQILSSTGDIRPFSEDADGTVLGEGIGLVVLKRLEDAEKDGDRIYAVIRGLGSASDGKSQSIYAPRHQGQAKALKRAYTEANIDPETVDLVEAHGTGTRVGDQVEFKALCEIFGETSPNGNRCALGSVKSNIGHTKAAAGTAGLIKTALSIYHKVLPPTLKAEPADPKLGVEHSPFYLNSQLRPWVSDNGNKRRAGVSAFGFGGSNFHAVLEEHSADKLEPSWDGTIEIAAFSGADEQQLTQKIKAWQKEVSQGDCHHTIGKAAKQSRLQFNTQDSVRLIMAIDLEKDLGCLEALCDKAVAKLRGNNSDNAEQIFIGKGKQEGKIAFMFPGQGSQYVGMGRDLICCFPESLEAFTRASTRFDTDEKLKDYVFPRLMSNTGDLETQLRQTQIAQPAIGAVSAAMLNALSRFNVKADAVCGHSYGELVALYAAGWMNSEDLWKLSIRRGQLMSKAGKAAGESGKMLAVKAPLDQIEQLVQDLDGQIVLANRNSHEQAVLSGSATDIEAADKACKDKGWRTVQLPVAAAFHSPLVANAQEPFAEFVKSVKFTPGSTMVMSNTLGKQYPHNVNEIQSTLGKQLASSVDFVANIETLYQEGVRTFIEIGPKTVLTQLVRSILKDKEFEAIALDQSSGHLSGIHDLASALCRLAASGVEVSLDQWEKPQVPKRKTRMAISLSGANYRLSKAPGKKVRKVNPHKKQEALKAQLNTSPVRDENPPAQQQNAALSHPPSERPSVAIPNNNNNTKMNKEQSHVIQNALSNIQQGLASIQALQSQTVQAHQKFLETQAEAGKTLRQMILTSQQLAAGDMGAATPSINPPQMEPAITPASPKSEIIGQPQVEIKTSQPASTEIKPGLQPKAPLANDSKASNAHRLPIEESLMDIVSQLTGYPSEMLGMEMDIESDLGIDSIKRVEILSALEEKLPQLPKVTPDMMGTLKTLGQICDYLSSTTDNVQASEPSTAPVSTENGNGSQEVQEALTDIVSQLTGYPSEMLGMEMDIESDLGIDSIKRVEILSALEEKMPQLPKVTPDMMGTLKTLGQICDYLSSTTDNVQASEPSAAPVSTENGNGSQEVQEALTDIVSQLTGYPSEMLGMEMDIESDLGIDSIKRVEILSALEEKLPQLPKVTPDLMGTLKTLGQIIEYLAGPPTAPATLQNDVTTQADDTTVTVEPHPVESSSHSHIDRQIIEIKPLDEVKGTNFTIADDHFVGVVRDRKGICETIVKVLRGKGVDAKLVEAPENLSQDLPLAGLIIISPMEAQEAFQWAKTCGPILAKASQTSQTCFITLSFLDGAFGFNKHQLNDPYQGSLAGLAKTASIEWKGVHCLAIDIDPHWEDIQTMVRKVTDEILALNDTTPLEIGLGPNGRIGLNLVPSPIKSKGQINLTSKDVAIITGGARGVTAQAARALAAETPCSLVLMGRSPAPQEEPDWLLPLTSESDIKRAIVNLLASKDKATPKEVEQTYQKWMNNREVLTTLDALSKVGVSAHYACADVRDPDSLDSLFNDIRNNIGPIKAIIHGAGVLEDRLIIDKQLTQFDKVYGTKVQGLENLLKAAKDDDLKYLVFFSSVSARMGNQGQSDYAMANEVLNKIAQQQSGIRQKCKVLSINWGPWDGGMVTPSLKRNFLKNNIALIPAELGSMAMVNEMAQPSSGPVEIVIGGFLPGNSPANEQDNSSRQISADLTLTCKREVNLDRYPFLEAHQLDGRPVVPLALITEWLAHSALHAHPGLVLHGMDNLRLLNGITLDRSERMIRMLAGKADKKGEHYEVEVEIRDGVINGMECIHSTAKAILSEQVAEPPHFIENGHFKSSASIDSLDDIYERILFHGEALRGIKELIRITPEGISARLSTAPPPGSWINDPLRSRWIADPLVLDSAFQMAIIWCYENQGLVSLPSFAASYRQYCHRFPQDEVIAVLEVHKCDDRKMVGDFTFLDQEKKVLANLKGYEAVMDPGLMKAFKAA